MRFRTRVAFTIGIAALVPLAMLAFGVRREMKNRLTRQAASHIQAQVQSTRESLADQVDLTRDRLERIAQSLAGDNDFRLAVVTGGAAANGPLRDWAAGAMQQRELDMLELLDSAGGILSSGHFRNEFGRNHRDLVAGIKAAPGGTALVRARTPEGELQVLALVKSFQVAGRQFDLVGGRGLNLQSLTPASDPSITAHLPTAESLLSQSGSEVAGEIAIPLVHGEPPRLESARLVLRRDLGPVTELLNSVDRWFLGATFLVLLLASGLALWLGARVTRPLAQLADKTAKIDLDRLDQEFATDRNDEIGALARLLDAMTSRLRSSTARLREAERRAATGDLARQINHDVKNGLAPIRHVLRHLTQVADSHPDQLPAVYGERRATLESSVEYLENLARNYARLSPSLDRTVTAPNPVLQELARSLGNGQATIELRLGGSVPPVRADAVVLRRILENLAGNAIDAVGNAAGTVILSSDGFMKGEEMWVRLGVADTGPGMSEEELGKAFDDFYTTKSSGTGLGLSVVRRLVLDLGGTLRVETAPGQGSRFVVELPAV
jgi:signal transduction histidine kinase